MTRKSLIALAGTLITLSMTSVPSEAGSGVRVGFGYPMGSFVATPARGYATPSKAYASSGYKAEKCPKKAAAARLARASRDNDAKVSRATSKPSRETTQVAAIKKDEEQTSKVVETTETSSSTEPALTGSKALAGTDAQTSESSEGEKETVATAEETGSAGSEPVVEAVPAAKSDEDKDVGCKKFVPAIGVTVSVGCDK